MGLPGLGAQGAPYEYRFVIFCFLPVGEDFTYLHLKPHARFIILTKRLHDEENVRIHSPVIMGRQCPTFRGTKHAGGQESERPFREVGRGGGDGYRHGTLPERRSRTDGSPHPEGVGTIQRKRIKISLTGFSF